ncbi:hypothetical protein M0R45_006371 [Rubus argutus]|uniref:Uncharacterized protein n=1 Tax=Rubus argutus TaxID=59490 RepID=A0AAW1YR05_RUBAR
MRIYFVGTPEHSCGDSVGTPEHSCGDFVGTPKHSCGDFVGTPKHSYEDFLGTLRFYENLVQFRVTIASTKKQSKVKDLSEENPYKKNYSYSTKHRVFDHNSAQCRGLSGQQLLEQFPELQAEAMSPGSNDSEDSTSADKVAESLIKAFEERNTQFVRNSLDTYAKEINGTVRELAKTVAALSAQMQTQQATLRIVLNERATFMSLL